LPTVQVRIPDTLYRKLREIAMARDVTIGQAFDFLFDELLAKATRRIEELLAENLALKAQLEVACAETKARDDNSASGRDPETGPKRTGKRASTRKKRASTGTGKQPQVRRYVLG